MKLPLLGIITIVVLQLGYTAYNALDRPLASLSPVSRVTIGTEPLAELANESDFALTSYAVLRANVRPVKDRDVDLSRAQRWRLPDPTPQKVIFKNTVIRIPPAVPLTPQLLATEKSWDSAVPKQPLPVRSGGEPETFSLATNRSSGKRSFASKSVSFLKKPYDWIKTLGSKLN